MPSLNDAAAGLIDRQIFIQTHDDLLRSIFHGQDKKNFAAKLRLRSFFVSLTYRFMEAAMEALKAFLPSLEQSHHTLVWTMLIIAPVTFVTLVFGPVAPYGRYTRSGWGPQLNGTFAW